MSYTILLIKEKYIKNEDKLNHVRKERELLEKHIEQYCIDYTDLLNINEKLWNIEDKIREKEERQEFDDEFIQIARSVYKTNDERSKIKFLINKKYNSQIIEIKSYQD